MGHIPVGMEMFSAADEQQWEIIKKQIDQSDYYVVIVAHRYGSMDGEISYTEKEYEYAANQKIPILGFVIDSEAQWPMDRKENNKDLLRRLEKFKTRVSGKMVNFWKSSDELYGKCIIALTKAFTSYPRDGWIRASEGNTSEMTTEITRLSRENGRLRQELEAMKLAGEEDQESRVDKVIEALRFNKRKIYVWRKKANNWGEPIGTNLLGVFEKIAPELLDEASDSKLGKTLVFEFAGHDYQGDTPVPTNILRAYLADLVSLDLVCTSGKRHTVSDTQAYWKLTAFGQALQGEIRRNELMKGLVKSEEAPGPSEGGE